MRRTCRWLARKMRRPQQHGGRIGRWLRTYDAFQLHAAICEAALPCPCRRCVDRDRRGTADLHARRAACLCSVRRIGAVATSSSSVESPASAASRAHPASTASSSGASAAKPAPAASHAHPVEPASPASGASSASGASAASTAAPASAASAAPASEAEPPAPTPPRRIRPCRPKRQKCDGARDRHAQALHAGGHAAPERARK